MRALVLACALFLVGAACGQKPNVAGTLAGGGGSGSGSGLGSESGDELGGTDGGLGTEGGDGTVAGGVAGGSGSAGGAVAGKAGGRGAGTAAGGAGGGGGGGGGNDRTGIDDGKKEIVIGLHAPVTGAAPFPQTTFEKGANVYWNYLKEKGGVDGYNVRLVFRNDDFNPSTAVRVCKEMAESEKAFLLIGGGGADQITACAKYANTAGIPYLSAGVNESEIASLRGYFAISMSYKQQSPMLAGFVKNKLAKTKLGIVVANTGSFNDAFDSIKSAASAAGLTIVRAQRIDKDANETQAQSEIGEMEKAGAEVVYVLTSPLVFIRLAQTASQTYNPIFIGPGISSGLNTVAAAGCPRVNNARFLSPFPQLDVIDQLDPDYRAAYRKQNPNDNPDDIGIALWGLNKSIAGFFAAAGPAKMSRQNIITTLESGKAFATNVYPPVKYSPQNHLGATQAHLLRANCGAAPPAYQTEAQFASSF